MYTHTHEVNIIEENPIINSSRKEGSSHIFSLAFALCLLHRPIGIILAFLCAFTLWPSFRNRTLAWLFKGPNGTACIQARFSKELEQAG